MGRARRLEGATRGGGMREVVGLEGGAMRFGLVGGGMVKEGIGTEALWAEFSAGKEGGGRLSSSSSSLSEFSCSLSVKVGTAGAFPASCGEAFGVVCGDGVDVCLSSASRFVRACSSPSRWSAGALRSLLSFCDLSGIGRVAERHARVIKPRHVDGERLYTRKESDMARRETATSISCVLSSGGLWRTLRRGGVGPSVEIHAGTL